MSEWRDLVDSSNDWQFLDIPFTGYLGSSLPIIGDNGGSIILNDGVINPNSRYRAKVTSFPSAGDLDIEMDGSFTFSNAPDGQYTFTYVLYEDGVLIEDGGGPIEATVTLNVSNTPINYTLVAEAGTLTFTGADVSFFRDYVLKADGGVIRFVSSPTDFIYSGIINVPGSDLNSAMLSNLILRGYEVGSLQDRTREYFNDQGYSGSNQDMMMDWLGEKGYTGSLTDRITQYLVALGYTYGSTQARMLRALSDGVFLHE